MNRHRPIGLPLAFYLFLLPSFAGASIIDQSFTSPTDLGADINEGFAFVGQTYTAGLTGTLAGVSVDIVEFSPNSFPLDVQIRTVMNGLPTTTILGETSTTAFSLADIIPFPETIPQVAGTEYAIVVDFLGAPPPGPGQSVGVWGGASGDLYPRGDLVFSSDEGMTWLNLGGGGDVHFITFVNTPVPEPSTLLLLGSGLLGLAGFRRRATRGGSVTKRGAVTPAGSPASGRGRTGCG